LSSGGWDPSVAPDLRKIAERLLTARQLEVYKLVARGYGLRRIAVLLGISKSAVQDRLHLAELKVFRELERLAAEDEA
jgi:DNA-binding CsgD family transcriptional regulator